MATSERRHFFFIGFDSGCNERRCEAADTWNESREQCDFCVRHATSSYFRPLYYMAKPTPFGNIGSKHLAVSRCGHLKGRGDRSWRRRGIYEPVRRSVSGNFFESGEVLATEFVKSR